MARIASVSDVEIFTAVKILADRLDLDLDSGERPSKYAVRKYLMEAKPGEAMPSYGLIEKAMAMLDRLLAAGDDIDELINEDAVARAAIENGDDSDAVERLTVYLTETFRPIAKKLIDDAQTAASNRELELETQLDEVGRECDKFQQSARTLGDQLLENTRALMLAKNDLQAAEAQIYGLDTLAKAQVEQIDVLKTIAKQDRDALDREREHHRTTLQKLNDAAAQREQDLKNQLRLAQEATAALQNTVATLSADKTALYDKHRAEIQQREALQTICNEQLTAINAAEHWRKELLSTVDELREQTLEQERVLRTLQRSESDCRQQAQMLETECATLHDRVTQLVESETQLKMQLRENDVVAQSRIRELEGITAVLRESLTAHGVAAAANTQKT